MQEIALRVGRAAAMLMVASGICGLFADVTPSFDTRWIFVIAAGIIAALNGWAVGLIAAIAAVFCHNAMAAHAISAPGSALLVIFDLGAVVVARGIREGDTWTFGARQKRTAADLTERDSVPREATSLAATTGSEALRSLTSARVIEAPRETVKARELRKEFQRTEKELRAQWERDRLQLERNWMERVAAAERDRNDASSRVAAAESRERDLIARHESLESELASLQKAGAEAHTEVTQLQTEIAALRVSRGEIDERERSLAFRIAELEEAAAAAIAARDALERDKVELRKEFQVELATARSREELAHSALAELQAESIETRARNLEIEENRRQLHLRIGELERSTAALTEENQRLSKRDQELNDRLEAHTASVLESAEQKSRSTIEELRAEVDRLRSRNHELDEKGRSLAATIDELETARSNAAAAADRHAARVEELTRLVEEHAAGRAEDLSRLREEHAAARALDATAADQQRLEMENLQASLASAESRIAELVSETKRLQDNLGESQRAHEEALAAHDRTTGQVAELRRKLDENEAAATATADEQSRKLIEQLQADLAAALELAEESTNQTSELKRRIETIESERSQAADEAERAAASAAHLERELMAVTARAEAAAAEADEAVARATEATARHDASSERLAELEKACLDLNQDLDHITEEASVLRNQLKATASASQESFAAAAAATAHREELERSNEELRQSLDRLRASESDLQRQVEESRQHLDAVSSDAGALRPKLEEVEQHRANLLAEVERLNGKHDEGEREAAELHARLGELETANARLAADVERLTKSESELSEVIAAASAVHADEASEAAKLRTELEDLRNRLEQADARKASHAETIAALEKQNADLTTDLHGLRGAEAALREMLAAREATVETTIADREATIQALRSELAEARAGSLEVLDASTALATRVEELGRLNAVLAHENEQLRTEHEELTAETQPLRSTHQKLLDEIEPLRSRHEELRAAIEPLRREHAALTAEVERLRSGIPTAGPAEGDRALEEMRRSRDEIAAELEQLRSGTSASSRTEAELFAARDQVRQLMARGEMLSRRIEELEEANADFVAANQSLTSKYAELSRKLEASVPLDGDSGEVLAKLRAELAEARSRSHAVNDKVGALTLRVEELQRVNFDMVTDNERLRRNEAELRERLRDEVAAAQSKADRAQAVAHSLASQVEALRADRGDATDPHAEPQKRSFFGGGKARDEAIRAAEARVVLARAESTLLAQQVDELKQAVVDIRTDRAREREEFDRHHRQLEEQHRSELLVAQTRIEEASTHVSTLLDRIDEMQRAGTGHDDSAASSGDLAERLQAAERAASAAESEARLLRDRLQELEEQNSRLRLSDDAIAVEQKLQEAAQAVERMKALVHTAEGGVQVARAEGASYRAQARSMVARLDELEGENAALRSDQGRLAALEEQIGQLKSENSRLRQAEADAGESLAKLTREISSIVGVAESRAEESRAEAKSLRARVDRLQRQNAELTKAAGGDTEAALQTIEVLETELAAARQRIEELTKIEAQIPIIRGEDEEIETTIDLASSSDFDSTFTGEDSTLTGRDDLRVANLTREADELRFALERERAERERLEVEWNEKLQTIVSHIASDHEEDIGQSLVAREEARAEVRSLSARVASLTRTLETERARFRAAQEEWARERARHRPVPGER